MWLLITIGGYLINAGVYTADKFLLSKRIHSSISYAFFVGIWSIFNLVLLPLAFWVPDQRQLFTDLLAGMLFLIALIAWYKALHQSEATRVVPIVGALTPVFSLMLSYIFLDETFTQNQLLAFFILIAGGVLISVKETRMYAWRAVAERIKNIVGNMLGHISAEYRPTRRLIFNSILSALCFAVYYVLIKYIYLDQPFVGGFVWSRLGTFLGCIIILFVPQWKKLIAEHQRDARKPKNLAFFLSVRIVAALAFIMLNWAISLGSVAMVNALQGVQFLFLIIIVLVLSSKYPHILKEELGRGVLAQKFIGMILIGLGLYVLMI
jgi:drug/metabolite transporter (DMT)-like permease